MLPPPVEGTPEECSVCFKKRVSWNDVGEARFACGATTLMLALGFHPEPVGKTDAQREIHERSIALYKKHRTERGLGRDPMLGGLLSPSSR